MKWQDFEVECTDYLNKEYGVFNKICFVHVGKSNSTVSDIKVLINGTLKFYIEVKMETSQCGQFVLLPDWSNKHFVFSEKNSSIETPITRDIITHMNNNFDEYVNGGVLKINKSILYDWVKEYYKGKNVKYVITSYSNKYIIFPIEKFPVYFDISGVYRVKRSGSHSPTKNQQKQTIELLKNTTNNFSYDLLDDNLIVRGDELKRGKRFDIGGNTYWLAEHQNGYRVRVLSKTANKNVIFSIFLQKHIQDMSDLETFISDLK